jgi:hypothetical protein
VRKTITVTFASKVLRLLLIAALAIMPAPTGALAFSQVTSSSAPDMPDRGNSLAGCHGQVGAASHSSVTDSPLPDSQLRHSRFPHQPAPTNYQCCLTGHDVAVVQACQSWQPSNQSKRLTSDREPSLAESTWLELEPATVLSANSSLRTPLRI